MTANYGGSGSRGRELQCVLCLVAIVTAACGRGSTPTTVIASQAPLQNWCNKRVAEDAMKDDSNTTVLLIRHFKKGDPLPNRTMEHYAFPDAPMAVGADLCLVKLLVGPPIPGPADAPSTTAGIGIEVWLPTKANWNGRVQAMGGTGWSGGEEADLTRVSSVAISADHRSPSTVAAEEGYVTSSTDTGHGGIRNGSFGMNPDGTINAKGWQNFSARALHEQAVKTKALAAAFYGSAPKYSYFSGASGGGHQAINIAQRLPDDYDGILAGVPAINWTRLMLAMAYPQFVTQHDLGGKHLTKAQATLVSNAATAACDVIGEQHLGFVLDYGSCRYDPTKDTTVLCASDGGRNSTAACVTRTHARAINKIWYGMTSDGSVPDPAVDNGWDGPPSGVRRWYGLPRGTDLVKSLAGPGGGGHGKEWLALVLQNPKLAGPSFKNATGNGEDGWKSLSYAAYAEAFDRAVARQPEFSFVDASNPDLSAFKASGAKMIHYQNLNDDIIFSQGSIDYYQRVVAKMGSIPAVQSFYRLYMVPGLAHAIYGNGTTNPDANPPIPRKRQLFDHLVAWVEKGHAPEGIVFASASSGPSQKSLPLCAYPAKPTHVRGTPFGASSYACQ